MKILLTGFDPFGGSAINPSAQVVQALAAVGVDGAALATAILPVDRVHGPEMLLSALDTHQPDVLLMLGQAGGRAVISIERVAINLMDYRIADNGGQKVTDEPIVPGGPAAYFATVPVRAMLSAIQAAGIPAELSLSAGAYLCNQVLYTALHHAAQRVLPMQVGFIHLPYLPEQAAAEPRSPASMALPTMVDAVRAALAILAGGKPIRASVDIIR